jgi:glycerol-3-phosphate dehydrogenase
MAPHLIRPLRFVLPLDSRYRSPAVLRLGLFIYDMIGRRKYSCVGWRLAQFFFQ